MEWDFELLAGPYGGRIAEKPIWGGPPAVLGVTEGPAWDGQALLFTHLIGNRIMRYDPVSGACTEFRTGTHQTIGLMFDAQGRLYGCQAGQHCIARFESDGSVTQLPNKLDGRLINRPNDLAIDRKGRIWFSDPFPSGHYDPKEFELDHASILRLDPQADGNWTLRRMTFDTTYPNGLLLSPDERTLYVAQSPYKFADKRELRAYPIQDDDTLGAYRVLHNFGEDARLVHRAIDGMCLDVEGNIIATAGWRTAGPGPMIYVFAPSGRVLETHPFPVDMPTNCTYGDADLGTLYITTSAGHLFRVRNTGRKGWLLYPR